MINVSNVTLAYGWKVLFKEVNIKFTPGNCYGVIGVNGSGKSTFLKILSGDVEQDKVRVLLARALYGNPDVLLLDEPTNHLDLESLNTLNNGLIAFPEVLRWPPAITSWYPPWRTESWRSPPTG